MNGKIDPFGHENLSEMSIQDSQKSDKEKFSRKHIKSPVVDWAFTSIFQKVLKDEMEFNR